MSTEVHAVLLVLAGDTLLLPNAAVAEILSSDRLRFSNSGPDWQIGTIPYQDRLLRVIHFEGLNGRPVRKEQSRRTRVAVINGLTGKLPTGQFAILCEGHPNLVTLNREAMKSEPRNEDDREDLALARVKIANTKAVIPNLELIETELAKLDGRD